MAVAQRVDTEEDAQSVIVSARRTHHDARHHCSAFALGADADLQRSHDDGEPAGTAGAPILEAIHGSGYSDVVVVVTRWFGGTLLGSGGLVRAYGTAAKNALANATAVQRKLVTVLTVHVGHDIAGPLAAQLHANGTLIATEYTDVARFTVAAQDPAEVRATIFAVTSGAADICDAGHQWMDV